MSGFARYCPPQMCLESFVQIYYIALLFRLPFVPPRLQRKGAVNKASSANWERDSKQVPLMVPLDRPTSETGKKNCGKRVK